MSPLRIVTTFNRTAYGIEIYNQSTSRGCFNRTFNRTAYGIEMNFKSYQLPKAQLTFNRTAYGIEMYITITLYIMRAILLIAPLMELKCMGNAGGSSVIFF